MSLWDLYGDPLLSWGDHNSTIVDQTETFCNDREDCLDGTMPQRTLQALFLQLPAPQTSRLTSFQHSTWIRINDKQFSTQRLMNDYVHKKVEEDTTSIMNGLTSS